MGRHKRRPVHGCPVSRGENETRNEDGGGTYTSPRSLGGLPGGNDTWWLLFSHPVTSNSLQLNNKHLGRISNDVHRQEGVLPAEGIAQQKELRRQPSASSVPICPFCEGTCWKTPDTGPATLGRRSTEGLETISRLLAQGDFRKPESDSSERLAGFQMKSLIFK